MPTLPRLAKPSRGRGWSVRIESLGEGPGEPLLDPISPGGTILRVHLRPYVAAGGDPERLLAAFLQTGREHRGSTERLAEWGRVAARMAESGQLPFEPAELRALLQGQASTRIRGGAPFAAVLRELPARLPCRGCGLPPIPPCRSRGDCVRPMGEGL